jgi:hypothetical protein
MKDLEIKEDPLYKYRQEAENFMSRIREREHEPLRYQGDTPF